MSSSSTLALLCEDGAPAELLFTYDGTPLKRPISQLRFYFAPDGGEPVAVATYVRGIDTPDSAYAVIVDKAQTGAYLLMDAKPFRDKQQFQHFVVYTTADDAGQFQTGSTLQQDQSSWTTRHVCGTTTPTNLPIVGKHALDRRMGLIVGLSAGVGSLLLMLLSLVVCCCIRRHRKKAMMAEEEHYQHTYHAGKRDFDDEFDFTSTVPVTVKAVPQKKESATSSYLKSYYSKLHKVKEEHNADSDEDDGEAHVVLDEMIA
jgi:hypothetical protein